MKILALEHEVHRVNPEQTGSLLQREATQVWELYQAGVFREIYFNQQNHTAVIILECTGADQAQEALASLPLVQAGLIEFEIVPLEPYNGFERLFK